jgi:UDP-N-acetylmuramate dehydrogenase
MKFDAREIITQLSGRDDLRLEENVRLAPYTSYRIGGPARLWIAPHTDAAVGRALEIVGRSAAPLFVLGRGTNLLVSDRGWEGVILYIGENLTGWHFTDATATVQAGTLLIDLVRETVNRGLGGMESMAGIPGGVGGALQMNAGAFGQEIDSVTVLVRGYCRDGRPFRAKRAEIGFGYRRAAALEGAVVTEAQFRFAREDDALLKRRMNEILARRAARQPLHLPSCGSVFKRPPDNYAGALIEQAGLKGERIGDAMVSPRHAGFIVNLGHAGSDDVYRLIRRIENRVLERFGVTLEREVRLVGGFPD